MRRRRRRRREGGAREGHRVQPVYPKIFVLSSTV